MAKVIIIGAGGVGSVCAHKCAQNPEVFSEIVIASRTRKKCDALAKAITEAAARRGQTNLPKIETDSVDADSVEQLCELFRRHKPEMVINLALPYQDLTIMEACLECGVNYLDTANYEPRDVAHFEYSWQWAYRDRFEKAGLTAILGCGFDPGVSGVFTAYAAKHYFSAMETLDIVDCNAGNHGKAFATNYPNIGARDSYLLYHEELESLVQNFPTIKRARFWMTFGQEYLTHLRVIQDIGMARIDEIDYNGQKIVPLQFLKAVLPDPQNLGENYTGETSIGCRIYGLDKDGKPMTYYIYNNCSHHEAYLETGMQAVSYTTGVPAMVGAMMFLTGKWKKAGVHNVEEFDPDPFLEELAVQGLPWHEILNGDLEVDKIEG